MGVRGKSRNKRTKYWGVTLLEFTFLCLFGLGEKNDFLFISGVAGANLPPWSKDDVKLSLLWAFHVEAWFRRKGENVWQAEFWRFFLRRWDAIMDVFFWGEVEWLFCWRQDAVYQKKTTNTLLRFRGYVSLRDGNPNDHFADFLTPQLNIHFQWRFWMISNLQGFGKKLPPTLVGRFPKKKCGASQRSTVQSPFGHLGIIFLEIDGKSEGNSAQVSNLLAAKIGSILQK